MEMSGLDARQCRILEVAALVTDGDYNPLEEYEAVVFQVPEVLAAMDEWNTHQHGKSGLTAAVANGKQEALVEQEILALISRHFLPADRPVLAGNSIGQDRKFIDAYMPALSKRLHYRMLDVSSFKIVFNERYGITFDKGEGNHRALDDIQQSVKELRHYLGFVQAPARNAPKP